MEDSEAQLTVSEADALGADFITVELDTQPIEYVVKWAEVGSKFTISCVKKDSDEPSELSGGEQLKMETDEAFFVPYEEVYPCEVTEQSVEIKMESDDDDDDDHHHQILVEVGGAQPDGDGDSDRADPEPDGRQYRCGYCGKCYSHASSLYRHQQTHAAKMAAAPAPPSAKRALEPAHQDARYACQHCGMTFKGSRMLGSHLRLHGKRRIHPCNICGKEFNHSSSLSRHRLIHKKAKDGALAHAAPHRPSLKGKKAKRRRQPAAVMQVAGGDKFYACPQCDMSFRTSTQLSKHQVTHVKELLDSYTQPGKENVAESSSDLKIRLKLCSRDKPNFYTLCKKNRRRRRSRTKRTLDMADDEEDGDGPAAPESHGCRLCGKHFSHTSSLARHQLSHQVADGAAGKRPKTKSKTFTCAACNKTFMHSSSFSRHKKAHLGATAKRVILDETAPIESDSD